MTTISKYSGLLLSGFLSAQGQCAPPTHLPTQEDFISTHYYPALGQDNQATPPIPQAQPLPANYVGVLEMCDLTATAQLTVTQLDFKLHDDGVIRFNWGTAPGVAGPPGLVTQTAVVNVYSTPTTWTGTWPTPNGPTQKILVPPGPGSPWTPVATGNLTIMGYQQHSPAVFPTPFTIPVGTTGFVFVIGPVTAPVPGLLSYQQPPYALHPGLVVQTAAPGTPLTNRDQFLTITNADLVNNAWQAPPTAAAKNPIFDIHYTVGANDGFFTRYGSGCYDLPNSFYEEFPPAQPTSFDLSNTCMQLAPVGNGYAVANISPSPGILPPVAPPLTNTSGLPLADDDRTLQLGLGFTFPYPGGSTTQIVITSNGNIFIDPVTILTSPQQGRYDSFGVLGFLRGQPQLAPLWTDLDPAASRLANGGDVYFWADLTAPVPVAYVTWLNVQEWNQPTTSNTVQVAMYANGLVEYRYGACNILQRPTLVGFNPGWSTHDPGNRDLSASMPFVTGDGTVPPALTMDARPVIGTTPNLVMSDLPVTASGNAVGLQVFDFLPLTLPLDLGMIGMPGCMQHVSPMGKVLFIGLPNSTTHSLPIAIPNNNNLLGLQVSSQAIAMSPGSNAAGLTVSNPICIRLGF